MKLFKSKSFLLSTLTSCIAPLRSVHRDIDRFVQEYDDVEIAEQLRLVREYLDVVITTMEEIQTRLSQQSGFPARRKKKRSTESVTTDVLKEARKTFDSTGFDNAPDWLKK